MGPAGISLWQVELSLWIALFKVCILIGLRFFLLPKKIIFIIEQISNSFIWALDKKTGSKPRISWRKVCVPKAYGGLNICKIHIWYEVILLKSLWALVSKKDRSWIKWVNDYYLKGTDIFHFRVPSTASWMLARIFDSRQQLNGWDDMNTLVVNGRFNVQKAYLHRVACGPKPPCKALWCNGKASPRSTICLWKILQNRLPMKDRLSKWGIQYGITCVLCHQEDETRDHLFSCCPFIQNMHQHINSFVPDFR